MNVLCRFHLTGNCSGKGETGESAQEQAAVPDSSAAAAPKLPVDGGPDRPLPRKFSKTHEAQFSPGNEKPQGEGGVILTHIAEQNVKA